MIDREPKKEMKQTIPFIVTTEKMKMSRVCLSKVAITDSMLVSPHPTQIHTQTPPQRAESKEVNKVQQCHGGESRADSIRVLNEESS